MSRRTILVDGYNFIGATRGLRSHDLERSREALLDRMSRYARARGHEVVVVFDGADLPVDYYPRKGRAGVRAVFTDPGEKADPVLVAEARRLRGRCVVVTDDQEVRRGCEGAGAVVLRCEEFEGYVRRARAAAKEVEGTSERTEARPKPAAPLPEDDLDAWQRFLAGVEPLPGRGAPSPRAEVPPASPSPADDDATVLASLLDVPDAVARSRARDDLPRPGPREGPSRAARRIRNVLDDL